MWLVEQLRTILEYLENLIKAMTMRAEIEIEVCMPGCVMLDSLQPDGWQGCKIDSDIVIPIYSEPSRECGNLLCVSCNCC